MNFRLPKNTEKISWTKHSLEKMKFYKISESRLKRVLRHSDRVEKGIAPGTVALMQRTGSKKHPTEIWLMYQPLDFARGKPIKIKSPAPKGPASPKLQRGSPNFVGRQKLRVITAWRYPGISPVREEIPIPDDILKDLGNLI